MRSTTGAPSTLVDQLLSMELTSYCVAVAKPIASRLTFEGEEWMAVAILSASQNRIAVAWRTDMLGLLMSTVAANGNSEDPDRLGAEIALALSTARAPQPHPLADYPLRPLVTSFNYEGLRTLLALAATDSSVIFVGNDYCLPSLCAFGLLSAMQPLPWVQRFMPVASPTSVIDAVSRTKVIAGTHRSAVPLLLVHGLRHVWIADARTGTIGPAALVGNVFIFPRSDKLKQELPEQNLHDAFFDYWAAHCLGQYRKGMTGNFVLDPYRSLFPTISGTDREKLIMLVTSSSGYLAWVGSLPRSEAVSSFTDAAAKRFPDLFPERGGSQGAAKKFFSAMTKAKQTLRSMTTDTEYRYTQFMRSPEVFGESLNSAAHDSAGMQGSEQRVPLDCLSFFDEYHALLRPPPATRPATAAPSPAGGNLLPHARTQSQQSAEFSPPPPTVPLAAPQPAAAGPAASPPPAVGASSSGSGGAGKPQWNLEDYF